MITDKRSIPLGKLFVIWIMSGIVTVLIALVYGRIVKLPTEFLALNEVIRLIQGSMFFLAGLWALSTLDIDFKGAYANFNADINLNLKLTLRYFLIYALAAVVLIGTLSLTAMLLMKMGLFTMDSFNAYYASSTAAKLTQKNYLRDFVIRVPFRFVLYLFSTLRFDPDRRRNFYKAPVVCVSQA